MRRRPFLSATGLAALGLPGARAEAEELDRQLARGGCAVLIRHAQTESGIGDPPGFRLDNCSSQRQLSAAGRAQSQRLGQWFAARQRTPTEVLSSQWCRCTLTAELAFGRASQWPALNSTFGESARQPAQTRLLRARLARIAPGQFEVWVTHQVNMTDLTREYPAMGEAFLVDMAGRLLTRHAFA